MIGVPFSFLPPNLLINISRVFFGLGDKLSKKQKKLKIYLSQSEIKLTPKEYVSMCLTSSLFLFIFFSLLLILFLSKTDINIAAIIFIVLIFSIFIFIQQMTYPKLRSSRKIKDIERNLIPALQNMLVQLNSGIPLFNVLSTISDSDYGAISEQFRIAIRKINAGQPQTKVLEELARKNQSLHFRRTMWQIINGMKTGGDMVDVIESSLQNLSEEQVIQIQKYGAQLNPLAMFYMIMAVILPSLGITFIIILSSFLSLSEITTKFIFWGMLAIVFFFQLMFMGIIKTRRPNLLD